MDPAEVASPCTGTPAGACVLTANVGHNANEICWDVSGSAYAATADQQKSTCTSDTSEGGTWYPNELCPSALATLLFNTAGGCSTFTGSADLECQTKWYGLGATPDCFACSQCTIENANACSHP